MVGTNSDAMFVGSALVRPCHASLLWSCPRALVFYGATNRCVPCTRLLGTRDRGAQGPRRWCTTPGWKTTARTSILWAVSGECCILNPVDCAVLDGLSLHLHDWSSESLFSKLNHFDLDNFIQKLFFLKVKIYDCQGDLSDSSAEKKLHWTGPVSAVSKLNWIGIRYLDHTTFSCVIKLNVFWCELNRWIRENLFTGMVKLQRHSRRRSKHVLIRWLTRNLADKVPA